MNGRKTGDVWFAFGGAAGAALASTCCIVPLALVLTGVSGAWIGSLTALEPYKPYFITAALALIGLGFWRVYFVQKNDCPEDGRCARPAARRITKIVLWLSAFLVSLSATIGWWAPFFD